MVGKLQEGVALGLAILGQRVVLVDNLAKLEEIQLVRQCNKKLLCRQELFINYVMKPGEGRGKH